MISKKLQDALNAQINAEMWSAYLYLSMSVEAESKGLKGFGNWFFIQFREEPGSRPHSDELSARTRRTGSAGSDRRSENIVGKPARGFRRYAGS